MKAFKLLIIITITWCFTQSCGDNQTTENKANTQRNSNNWWHCPDNIKGFPPVDIKLWNRVPVVNGRLPTVAETENGTSLIYYDTSHDLDAKPYNMTLPKLATFQCPYTKKEETVIVIQIVQTETDTVVGYRYLTGGNGTYNFRDFHFLNDNEVKKVVGQ